MGGRSSYSLGFPQVTRKPVERIPSSDLAGPRAKRVGE